MLMAFMFIYNILLIFLYTLTISLSFSNYQKEKKKIFLLISLFILFFIFDNTIVYMTEFLSSFSYSYDQLFMKAPVAKTIIFLSNSYLSLAIVSILENRKIKNYEYFILIGMAIWLISIPLFNTSSLKIWLYYLPNQLFMLYLGVQIIIFNKKNFNFENKNILKLISLINIFFSIAIILEDTFVIFKLDDYSNQTLQMNNRSICEDLYSIIICLLIIICMMKYQNKSLLTDENPNDVDSDDINISYTDNHEEALENTDSEFDGFCNEFSLTQREKEVLEHLLNHEPNQNIADNIHLSLGTVKTHIHNIFIKIGAKKRNQVF